MVSLLSQIASRIDGPFNASTVKMDPPSPFAPTASSIRVNVFRFISLVLSLTTVLVGIVSLQWLREHQVYSDLSPREKYAVYNMRADGLKKWHVDTIFTSLPLLLRSALVLFLGGIIDFLHAIGYWAVTIPVAIAISFTLIFLIATTVLPCLQVLLLGIHFSPKSGKSPKPIDPPSQCPYKSPQSQAIRTIFRSTSSIYRIHIYPRLRSFLHRVKHYAKHSLNETPGPLYPAYSFDAFTQYLDDASQTAWQVEYDIVWLSIRDTYMRRSLNRALDPYYRLGLQNDDITPIHDIVAGLLSQNVQKSSAISAYYCFDEISLMFDDCCWYRQGVYLHDLVSNGLGLSYGICLSEFLCMAASGWFPPEGELYISLLRQQNIFLFLRNHGYCSQVPSLARHRFELNIRMMRYFQEENGFRTTVLGDQKIANCLNIMHDYFLIFQCSCYGRRRPFRYVVLIDVVSNRSLTMTHS